MKRCPACGSVYAHGGEFCAVDGTTLIGLGPTAARDEQPTERATVVHTTLDVGSEIPPDSMPTVRVDDDISGAELDADRAMIGTVIAGRFRIEELIGRGGMGVVYKARHLLLDRTVAVKLLLSRHLDDDKAAQRFFREAQTMARVEHPNAVSIFDFGVLGDGSAYIVMEFIDGETLRSVLGRVGRFPVDDAVAIADQICGAVEAAHRGGVVHRDLKPENIMFKRGDSGALVKVVDFGLAKLGERSSEGDAPILTSAGELFGTPAYMAPEYYETESIGAAADVYSIGVMVYEMLAGVTPFRGNIKSMVSGHLFKEPPPLGSGDESIPDGVKSAVKRALSKNPVERFASAAEFAAVLGAAIRPGEPARLETLRMSREELDGLADDESSDRGAESGGFAAPAPTDSMDAEEFAAATSGAATRVRPRVVATAAAAAILLGGTVVVSSMYLTPARPGGNFAPAAPAAGEGESAPADEGAPEGPALSGRDPEGVSARRGGDARSTGAARDGSGKPVSRMEVAEEPAAPAAEAPAVAPDATASTDRTPAAAKPAANTNTAKNSAAKPSKDAKKKKKWWNPASWF